MRSTGQVGEMRYACSKQSVQKTWSQIVVTGSIRGVWQTGHIRFSSTVPTYSSVLKSSCGVSDGVAAGDWRIVFRDEKVLSGEEWKLDPDGEWTYDGLEYSTSAGSKASSNDLEVGVVGRAGRVVELLR